jgi:CBS domain containing-hemolysin-like protein
MQKSGKSMVMVVDEFGGTAGLVTLKDLVAEIIGETHEPEDEEEPTIQILDERLFLVQAQMDLEEVNELLNLDLPLSEDYQTLGGFLIYQLQKIPEVGEIFKYDTCELTVMSAEGPRLHQIQLRLTDPILSSDEDDINLNDVSEPEPDAPPIDDIDLEAPFDKSLPDVDKNWQE